jgi:hypothetical protein
MDSVNHVSELETIGDAVAKLVDLDHFRTFVER